MHGIPKNRPKMEICQKIDVFPKIHTVKTLYRLTSPLAIKYHIVRYNIQKTRMIYLSTEKRNEHFFMTETNSKFLKFFLSYKSTRIFFLSIGRSF